MGKGEGPIRQDGKTYRKDFLGEWRADRDFLGNEKVERDFFGNPKIERDFFGNQKIERDFFGNPKVKSGSSSSGYGGGSELADFGSLALGVVVFFGCVIAPFFALGWRGLFYSVLLFAAIYAAGHYARRYDELVVSFWYNTIILALCYSINCSLWARTSREGLVFGWLGMAMNACLLMLAGGMATDDDSGIVFLFPHTFLWFNCMPTFKHSWGIGCIVLFALISLGVTLFTYRDQLRGRA